MMTSLVNAAPVATTVWCVPPHHTTGGQGGFNGNGQGTLERHRESTGFVYYRNTHTEGNIVNQFFFGSPGDRFVAGDWNGDGKDSPGVYRPSERSFHLRYTNSQGDPNETIGWGDSSWLPVSGRFQLP